MRLTARLERLEKQQALRKALEEEEYRRFLQTLSDEELERRVQAAILSYEAAHGEVEPLAAGVEITPEQWPRMTDQEFIALTKRDMVAGGFHLRPQENAA